MTWNLKVSGLAATSLLDMGSKRDPQDPMLQVGVGKGTSQNTVRLKDAGTAGKWTETFSYHIDEKSFNVDALEITANNQGLFGGHTLIGKGNINLKELIGENFNTAVKGEIKISNPKEANAGTVTFTAQLDVPADDFKRLTNNGVEEEKAQEIAPTPAITIASTQQQATLQPKVPTEKPQGEKTSPRNHQSSKASSDNEAVNDFLLDTSKPSEENKSVTHTAAASTAVVNEPIVQNNDATQGSTNPLEVGLSSDAGNMNENSMNNKTIGSNIKKDQTRKVKGRFEQGRLNITKIHLADLNNNNRETFVSLDLLNSNDTVETVPKEKSVEHSCEYSFMDMSMNVERYHIHEGKVIIHLYENNKWNPMIASKVLLGTAEIELDSLLLHIHQEVQLKGNFIDINNNENKLVSIGRITIGFQLEQWNNLDELTALEHGLGNGGVLNIKSLRVTDMKYASAMLSSDVKRPFGIFHYGDGESMTTDKEEKPKSSSIQWDHINYEYFNLNDEKLKNNTFNFELYDRGVMSNSLVGSCQVSLSSARLHEDCMVKCDIMNNGTVVGSLRVLLHVNDQLTSAQKLDIAIKEVSPKNNDEKEKLAKLKQDKIQSIISSFISGRFQIKSIDCKDMIAVELGAFLGDQNDPYIKLSYGTWSKETDIIDSGGSDAHWDDVYYVVDITRDTLTKLPLKIEVWDKNSTTTDAFIGQTEFLLSDHALEFDDDGDDSTINTNAIFNMKSQLYDRSGKISTGNITLECMMKPSKEELKELEQVIDVTEGVEKGMMFITKMKAHNLSRDGKHSDVELPYVSIDYCQNSGHGVCTQEESLQTKTSSEPLNTPIINGVPGPQQFSHVSHGADPTWNTFGYKQRVTRKQCQIEPMHIYIKENDTKDIHNTNHEDKIVSEGCLKSLLIVGSQVGKVVEVSVDLYAPGTDFTKPLDGAASYGELILFMTYEDTTNQDDYVIASPRIDGEIIGEHGADPQLAVFGDEGAYFLITYFQSKGLITNGSPVVSFMIGDDKSTKETLPVLKGANNTKNGGNLHWEYKSKIHLTTNILKTKSIEVRVEDQHTMRSNTLVGLGSAKLDFFYKKSRINKNVNLSVNLSDEKGKPTGRITIGCELRPSAEDKVIHTLSTDFVGGILHFPKIQTHNLKNTEYLGEADPYIIIKDQEGTEIGRTYTATNKGGSVLFNHLDIRTKQNPMTLLYQEQDLKDKSLIIEAWDDNVGFDKLIGSGILQLDAFIGPYNNEVELTPVHITDDKGNLTGRIHCFGVLEPPLPVKDEPINFPEKFQSGIAYIKTIAGFGIENKNMLGMLNKADPYLELNLFNNNSMSGSPVWTSATAPKMDSGDHALWNLLDFEFPVDRNLLEKGTLQIIAKDKNIHTSDSIIGCGTCSIKRAVSSLKIDENTGELAYDGNVVELSVDLNSDGPNAPIGKKSHGRIVVYIDIGKEQPDEATLHHKENFEYGIMRITKIRTFDLNNTEMFSSWTDSRQDPYIKLQFGDWTDKTHVKENQGSDVTWDFLTMETPLYLEDITQNKLRIQAWDMNHITKDRLIGTSETSIIKGVTSENIDNEVKLTMKLENEQKQPSGRVEVYVVVTEPKIGGEIPTDFDLGILTIKQTKLIGVKNNIRQPHVVFHLNEQREETERFGTHNEDSAEDPHWNMNFKFSCNKHDVHGKCDIVVDIMTHGRITGSTLYGKAKIELKLAGINLNNDVELHGVIMDTNNKRLGRVVIQAKLSSDVIKSLPIAEVLPSTFVTGAVIIKKLKLNLDNKFINRNLYARLEYGNWNECTGSQHIEKNKANIWALDMIAEVNKDILQNDMFKIIIMEEGSFLHGVREIAYGIATASISRQICQNLKHLINFELELLSISDTNAAASNIVGKAAFEVMLDDIDMSPENYDGLPNSVIGYKSANLQILKCSAFDLVGGDKIGKQDPYIIFTIENIKGEGINWEQQTDYKESGGRSAIWDLSDGSISTPIDADGLCYRRLKVTVMDKNNITSDSMMGEGTIGLKGAGAVPDEDKLLNLKLKDSNGKSAGRVEVIVNVNRDVDMSTGTDADGDGIDDGLQNNKMNGKLHVNNVWLQRTSGGHKTDKLYVQLKLHGWEENTGYETDRFGDTNWRWEPLTISSKKLNTSQILHDGINVRVYKAHGRVASPDSDKLVGELFKFSCKPALNSLDNYRDLKGDLHLDGKMVGKLTIGLKFTPDNLDNVIKQQEVAEKQQIVKPRSGDQLAPDAPISAANTAAKVDHKAVVKLEVNNMEKHLKAQLKQMIDAQTADLKKEITELERQQRKAALGAAKAPPKKEKWDIFNVTNVQLPANVNDWRVAHVQAWLAFQVELPAYMESFQKASIDGPMLLKKVDETTLPKLLSCTNELHKAKIMNALEELKERMVVVEKKAKTLREAKARKEEADHQAEIDRVHKEEEAALHRLEKAKHKKAHMKKKKSKSSGKHGTSTKKSTLDLDTDKKVGNGVGSEEAQINRVKMERAARLALEKSKAKMNAKSSTWKFEYTGTPKPQNGGIWDDETFQVGDHPELGTKAFQDAMETMDILDDGLQQGTYRKMSTNNRARKVHILPSNSSGEEVLAAIKEAMYNLSSRLLQIQAYAASRNLNNDDDLGSCDFSVEEINATLSMFSESDPKEPSPAYEDVASPHSVTGGDQNHPDAEAQQENSDWMAPPDDDDDDDDDDDLYQFVAPQSPNQSMKNSSSSPNTAHKKMMRLVKKEKKTHKPSYDASLHQDRVSLVYNALVHQSNNDAAFIGDNSKLTRLKLFGGCEAMLRLRLSWSQFDSLWTRLDSVRTGDLDLHEFKNFFGDLSEFEINEGIQNLTTVGNISDDMKALTKVLYQLCDVMRHAGFTVVEMFSSFDRDASGSVSINEFCSMLRLIVGPTFDKKIIYKSLLVLDTDRNKNISQNEFFTFIYKTWKQQLDDLDYRRCCLDEKKGNDLEKIHEIINERNLIKSCIKKNFPRELRDYFEKSGTALAGPFATMFQDDLNNTTATLGNNMNHKESTKSLQETRGRSTSPLRSGRPHSPNKVDNSGQIMRFKIKPPGAQSPTRMGEALTLPKIYNMSKSVEGLMSSEATQTFLGQTAPIGL